MAPYHSKWSYYYKKAPARPAARQLVIAGSPPASQGGLNGKGKKKNGNGKSKKGGQPHAIGDASASYGLNAFHPLHLPLPRPVAPYSVVRTIQNFTLAGNGQSQIWCFVPFYDFSDGSIVGAKKHNMLSFCGYKKDDTSLGPIGNGIDFLNFSTLQFGTTTGIECVPAAMTIRVTCPSSLQGATGQFFLGRWSVAADPRAYTSYEDMRSGFLSYGHPRPLTAARLGMRGVEVSSVARDMNVCSDFLPLNPSDAGNKLVTQGTYPLSDTKAPWPGFTPIILIAEDSVTNDTKLNIQVAVEWRWRFALDNVAASTHTYHKPASPATWSSIMEKAANGINGVSAIAEAVPAVVEAVGNAGRLAAKVGPMLGL